MHSLFQNLNTNLGNLNFLPPCRPLMSMQCKFCVARPVMISMDFHECAVSATSMKLRDPYCTDVDSFMPCALRIVFLRMPQTASLVNHRDVNEKHFDDVMGFITRSVSAESSMASRYSLYCFRGASSSAFSIVSFCRCGSSLALSQVGRTSKKFE